MDPTRRSTRRTIEEVGHARLLRLSRHELQDFLQGLLPPLYLHPVRQLLDTLACHLLSDDLVTARLINGAEVSIATAHGNLA